MMSDVIIYECGYKIVTVVITRLET